jgi:hypothetical protein
MAISCARWRIVKTKANSFKTNNSGLNTQLTALVTSFRIITSNNSRQIIWTIKVALHPNFPRNLPYVTPDDFARQAESAGAQWVNLFQAVQTQTTTTVFVHTYISMPYTIAGQFLVFHINILINPNSLTLTLILPHRVNSIP